MPSAPSSRAPAPSAMRAIFAAVAFYWVISISMVFVNMTLLSSEGTKIDAPLFMTWYYCVCTVFACYVLGELGFQNIPKFEVRLDVLRQVMPLSCIFTCIIAFHNFCLKYASFSYQISRSLTIAFTVALEFIVLGQKTSLPAIGCCAIVVSGLAIGIIAEIYWSLLGVLFGVTSSFFVALYVVTMKKVFSSVEGIQENPWKLILYNNINASIMFIPLVVLAGEPAVVLSSENAQKMSFWAMMTIAGCLGVLISFAFAALVKYTSPLTYNVSTTALATAQTVIVLMWFKNPITAMGAASVGIVLAGSLLYTLVRRSEMKKKIAQEEEEAENKAALLPSAEQEIGTPARGTYYAALRTDRF